MNNDLAVLVPVLNRPHRVRPTLDAFNATVPGARVLFVASPRDMEEREALASADADTLVIEGGYAAKIRAGVHATDQPYLFTAADDLAPQTGWYEAARACLKDGIEVVGVNDLIKRRRPRHATHFLMTRTYAEQPTLDGKSGPFSTAYHHWNVDDELIATATHRGVYAYAEDSHVRHEHPMNGGAPDDSTYRLGRSRAREDRRLFRERQALWT